MHKGDLVEIQEAVLMGGSWVATITRSDLWRCSRTFFRSVDVKALAASESADMY
jgi:hypothetical protein